MLKNKLKDLCKTYIILNIIMVLSLLVCKPLYANNEAFFWCVAKLTIVACNAAGIFAFIVTYIGEANKNV